ncbi:MAG: hypothetical protein ACYS6Z_09505, partial [Planctomycetota bacterium]
MRVRIRNEQSGGAFYVVNGSGQCTVAAARRAVRRACRLLDSEPDDVLGRIEALADTRFEYIVNTVEALLESNIKDIVLLGPGPGGESVPAFAVPV